MNQRPWPNTPLSASPVDPTRTSDMGAASSAGWPSWPDEPVRVPTNPGGCPPGSWPASDRYGPFCAGIGIGDLFYVEANAQFQPGPTRLGPAGGNAAREQNPRVPGVSPRRRSVVSPTWRRAAMPSQAMAAEPALPPVPASVQSCVSTLGEQCGSKPDCPSWSDACKSMKMKWGKCMGTVIGACIRVEGPFGSDKPAGPTLAMNPPRARRGVPRRMARPAQPRCCNKWVNLGPKYGLVCVDPCEVPGTPELAESYQRVDNPSFAARVGRQARTMRASRPAVARAGGCKLRCRRNYPKNKSARVQCYRTCQEL